MGGRGGGRARRVWSCEVKVGTGGVGGVVDGCWS